MDGSVRGNIWLTEEYCRDINGFVDWGYICGSDQWIDCGVGADVTVKQIWGTIFIVLGVILVVNGFSGMSDIESLDQIMQDTYKMTGPVNSGPLKGLVEQSQTMYASAAREARVDGWLRIVIGIVLSVLGTILLRDEEKRSAMSSERNQKTDVDEVDRHSDWKM